MINEHLRLFGIALCLLATVAVGASSLSATGSNMLEYRAATEGHSFLEDRADLTLGWQSLSLGLQFQAMHPSRQNPSTMSDTTYEGIAHRYLDYSDRKVNLRIGTLYETFGNGLLLDLYELHQLSIDHYLDGIRLGFDLPYVSVKGLSGRAHWGDNCLIRGGEITVSPPYARLGAAYLDYDHPFSGKGALWSASIESDLSFLTIAGEYAQKHMVGDGTDGEGLYLIASAYLSSFSLMGQYKQYRAFRFIGETQSYNNPPTCIREPSYTLQSRYYHTQNLADEQGYSAEFMGNLPFALELDVSYAHSQDSLGNSCYDELYAELYREWDKFSVKAIFENKSEGDNQSYNTFVLHLPYIYLSDDWTMVVDVEAQSEKSFGRDLFHTGGETELSWVSKKLGAGLELWNIQESDSVLKLYPFVFASYDIADNTSVRVGYGKRSGGFTCSGGVCRYEPAFEGVELTAETRF